MLFELCVPVCARHYNITCRVEPKRRAVPRMIPPILPVSITVAPGIGPDRRRRWRGVRRWCRWGPTRRWWVVRGRGWGWLRPGIYLSVASAPSLETLLDVRTRVLLVNEFWIDHSLARTVTVAIGVLPHKSSTLRVAQVLVTPMKGIRERHAIGGRVWVRKRVNFRAGPIM